MLRAAARSTITFRCGVQRNARIGVPGQQRDRDGRGSEKGERVTEQTNRNTFRVETL